MLAGEPRAEVVRVDVWSGAAGPRGRLVAASWQNRASGFPDTDYEFRGQVVSVDPESGRVDVELCEQSTTGARLMPGRGTVVLPRRGSA